MENQNVIARQIYTISENYPKFINSRHGYVLCDEDPRSDEDLEEMQSICCSDCGEEIHGTMYETMTEGTLCYNCAHGIE